MKKRAKGKSEGLTKATKKQITQDKFLTLQMLSNKQRKVEENLQLSFLAFQEEQEKIEASISRRDREKT